MATVASRPTLLLTHACARSHAAACRWVCQHMHGLHGLVLAACPPPLLHAHTRARGRRSAALRCHVMLRCRPHP